MKTIKRIFLLSTLTLSVCACSGFFDTDNTPPPSPLTSIKTEARVENTWSTSTGFGMSKDYLKLVPAASTNAIFTADKDGNVAAIDKKTGKTLWKTNTGVSITTGPGANDGIVVVCSNKGLVIALKQEDGTRLWERPLGSEMMAPPAIGEGVVIVKTTEGKVNALSAKDGHSLWLYQQAEPSLTLRTGSAAVIGKDAVIVGFENGNLAKLSLREGSLLWQQTIAEPEGIFNIQRMVDIDANPILHKNHIYVVTYQGKIASLDYSSGKSFWSDDMSDYAGIAADEHQVYVSDARGYVYAYNAESGAIAWRQTHLQYRVLSGPAAIGNYLVVGDSLGYLHWMSKTDGHFVARTKLGGSGIFAAPIVSDNSVYVVTRNGHLAAYTIS